MNWHNRHLLDISDTFRTFIKHGSWGLFGNDIIAKKSEVDNSTSCEEKKINS